MMRNKRVSTTVSVVLLGLIVIAFLFPFAWAVATSLKPTTEVFDLSPTGSRTAWDNYPSALNSIPFGRIVLNPFTALLAGATLVAVVSVLSAYAFARPRFKGRDYLFMLFLRTLVLSQEVLMIPLHISMQRMDLVNSCFALIVPFVSGVFGAFLVRQFLMSLLLELEEAARIDGCSDWKTLTEIPLPLPKAPITVAGVFAFIDYWSAFLWPPTVVSDSSLATIPLDLQTFSGECGTDWNPLMATVTMMTIPSTPLIVFLQKQLEKSITLGAFGRR